MSLNNTKNRKNTKLQQAFSICLMAMLLSACARWQEEAGVESSWRSPTVPDWTIGQSTTDDVMRHLGPPSQVISLQDQVVFYYMKEQVEGSGYFLLVYNSSESRTHYDRAIFFFDNDSRLLRYSYSDDTPLTDD